MHASPRFATLRHASLALILVLGLGSSSRGQGAIRVDNSLAPGTEDGNTWPTAYRSLDTARTVQATTIPLRPIWVRATGPAKPYIPTIRTDPSDPRSVTFALNGLYSRRVIGAFAGSEASEFARLGAREDTILDGDFAPGIEKPAYHVVTGAGGSATEFHVDGFRVINGRADGALREYTAGGGMYFYRATAWIRNCEFAANFALRAGGAFAIETESSQYQNGGCQDEQCWIGHCLFEGNSAARGGAVYARDYHEIIDYAPPYFAGDRALGTAVHNCEFRNNSAMDGGAVHFEYPLSAALHVPTSLSIFGNLFLENRAVRGGAICLHPNNGARIVANTFSGNNASGAGTCLNVMAPDEVFTSHACESITTITGPQFEGNICWGNATLVPLISSTVFTATNNDTQGTPLPGAGNISVDPQFVPGGFALAAGSPCIDSGAVTGSLPQDFADLDLDFLFREPLSLDLLRMPRVAGVSTIRLDMGALERQ